jgi:hypothetical protein
MNKSLAERIVSYLKTKKGAVKRSEMLKIAEHHGYTADEFFMALEVIDDSFANIGQWKDMASKTNYLRYYPPNELTNKVQECLDRGDDW